MSHSRLFAAFVACACSTVAPIGAPQTIAQEVGTAAAVNPSAQARGAGGSRTIIIGQSIAHRERIQTTSAGSVQLVFLDKTSMTVGPNSDLAIDEYVYDPASNTGKLAATLSKGVMRFVGGQISHAGNAQVSTSNAVVGIRGGVGIFHPNSVYIGFGQGVVTSGSSTITLGAGDFTQTPGGGAPPSPPGPPPEGFLQSVLATLQSRSGQGGGAPATTAQVNRARTAASGSERGNIASNVQNALSRPITYITETLWWLNQSVITAANQARIETGGVSTVDGDILTGAVQRGVDQPFPTQAGNQAAQTLVGYTGGLVQSIGRSGSLGQNYPAFGVMALLVDSGGSNGQANFTIAANNSSQNALRTGTIQFGSINPSLPSGRVTISEFDQLIGSAEALLPAASSSGTPLSSINGQPLIQHSGVFIEFKPGSQLSNALSSRVGASFCQCEHTRWGLWDSQSIRPGPNNATIEERARMFWVAGKLPSAGDVPLTGSATYDGHAIANIRNGSQAYIAAGAFQNTVNFGSRTGTVAVTGLDSTNYSGQMTMLGSDPRFFTGTLSGGSRSMALSGSFFAGTASAVGEMGGALQLSGPSYSGGGIFAGRMR